MKRIAWFFSVILLSSAVPLAATPHQDEGLNPVDPPAKSRSAAEQRVANGDLKGPRAKNYPTHRYRSSPVVVEVPGSTTGKQNRPARMGPARMGPAAKNYRPWRDTTTTRHRIVSSPKNQNLKGPRAKNRKPWNN